jgi:hypothetical protein
METVYRGRVLGVTGLAVSGESLVLKGHGFKACPEPVEERHKRLIRNARLYRLR